MKKFMFAVAVLCAGLIVSSCEEELADFGITVDPSSNEILNQILESNDLTGSSVSFKTSGAWTSEIKGVPSDSKSYPMWLSIDPDHGDSAGDYTIKIELLENETDADRTAEVVIKSGEKTLSMKVTQKARPYIAVSSVILNSSELTIVEGESSDLTATVQPADATDKTVVWSSDKPSVAEVSEGGRVTALSEGVAVITAKSGDVSSTCTVTVKAQSAGNNYIDEYGIDHGPGISVSNIVWAPVNCGYHKDNYKYGKMYQWGRKYGSGYSGSDAVTPTVVDGGVTVEDGRDPDNADKFFKPGSSGNDWLATSDDKLWNAGTEDAPVKTENDPCPDGWRVPTYKELNSLQSRKSSWTTNEEGQNGYWFSMTATPDQKIFLPAAGRIAKSFGEWGVEDDRTTNGYYWSSKPYNNGAANYLGTSKYSVGGNSNYRVYGYSVRCVKE